MKYEIAAHPTKYQGVQFRSRLEARWAAFFDLIRWSWLYEPIDLKDWVPDFQLRDLPPNEEGRLFGESSASYIHWPNPFVEIKPVDNERDFDIEKIYQSLPENSCCLLLGFSPFFETAEISIRSMAFDGVVTPRSRGWDTFSFWANLQDEWNEAGNIVQWRPK